MWRPGDGDRWTRSGGYALGPPRGGTAVVDPGSVARVVVQVDVVQGDPGAGVVFRWKDVANHLSVEAGMNKRSWVLVATVGTVRRELGRIPVRTTDGTVLRVTSTRAKVAVAVDGSPKLVVDTATLAAGTQVGMTATDGNARFDQFAVLKG